MLEGEFLQMIIKKPTYKSLFVYFRELVPGTVKQMTGPKATDTKEVTIVSKGCRRCMYNVFLRLFKDNLTTDYVYICTGVVVLDVT